MLPSCMKSEEEEDQQKERDKLVQQLRHKILACKNLHCPTDAQFLEQFLRIKDWRVDAAWTLLLNFFIHKGIVFRASEMRPRLCTEVYAQNIGVLLKKPDPLGRRICLVRLGLWDTRRFSFDQIFMSAFLYFLESAHSVQIQEYGLVFLLDLNGFTLDHARSIGIINSRNISKFVQGSIPARIKAIHIVNNPYLFNFVFSIVKQFIKDKMKHRFFFHGYDLCSLHKAISPELLPQALGGHLTETEAIDETIVDNMLQKDEYYAKFSTYGFI